MQRNSMKQRIPKSPIFHCQAPNCDEPVLLSNVHIQGKTYDLCSRQCAHTVFEVSLNAELWEGTMDCKKCDRCKAIIEANEEIRLINGSEMRDVCADCLGEELAERLLANNNIHFEKVDERTYES